MFDSLFLDFSNGFSSFLDAFMYGFYYAIRCFAYWVKIGTPTSTLGGFWIFIFTQIVILVITIIVAKQKDLNPLLAIFLGLSIPLLGAFSIILLLPEQTKRYIASISNPLKINSEKGFVSPISNTKRCVKCGANVNENVLECPKCKGGSFK